MVDFFYIQVMSWDREAFRKKIEVEHKFPGNYIFKFIVPSGKKEEIVALLPKGKISFRNSSGEKYISVTLDARLGHAREVIEVYEEVYKVEGVVAL